MRANRHLDDEMQIASVILLFAIWVAIIFVWDQWTSRAYHDHSAGPRDAVTGTD